MTIDISLTEARRRYGACPACDGTYVLTHWIWRGRKTWGARCADCNRRKERSEGAYG